MTLIEEEQKVGGIPGHIDDIVHELRQLKTDLRRVQGLVKDGEPGSVKEALRTASDVRTFLRIAYEVEAKHHEDRRRDQGGASGELDLDAARAEIGCKLDRLRRCCGAGEISG
ncbi:MAG: hypothetical protein ACPH5G_05485 [Pseudooceanicola atlanticus]